MSTSLTPERNFVTDEQIEQFRENRVATKFEGCTQLFQYFIKADGTMSCSCMRYWDILADMRNVDAGAFYNGPMMKYIRESFAEGYEPFPFCDGCASRLTNIPWNLASAGSEYKNINLHIEPSNDCNLYCEACICTFERLTTNVPERKSLEYELYEKFLNEIKAAGLTVQELALVGFGEPLFNSRTPDMARLARQLFPSTSIFLDTNANFGKRRAEELADCGLDKIRLSLDGVDQSSYEGYRRNGEFDKALQFMKELAAEIRRTGSSTRALWKYILFDHNDRDEQLLAAVKMADEIGIPITFDGTVGANASRRTSTEIEALVGQPIGCNIDPSSTSGGRFDLRDPEEGSALWKRLTRLRRRESSNKVATADPAQ
jgi:hypothetical protein